MIAGDGAFGLNGFEFETLTRFGLPVVFVIGNDAAWGEIRIPQRGIYGEDAEVATLLAPTRYDLLTEAFGGHGEHVERPDELAPALERALASGEPAIVNVMLDPLAHGGARLPRDVDRLRQEELLARHDRRVAQVVRLLELPDAVARVAAVPRRRDRPERVGRLDDVVLRLSGAARAAGEHGPRDRDDQSDDDDRPNMCSLV